MTEPVLCPQCDSAIPAGSPAGLCPKCLVLAGLESQPLADPRTEATQPPPSPAGGPFVPSTIEELAAKFPQLEIIELLGQGGMGAVYKARQRELDRLVAVKILPPEVSRDPSFAERFTREARALARLSHPNIVGVHDFGKTNDGLFFFVMEYVDGVNLRQAIQAGGMDPNQALAIVPQICDALQFAHDEGIVHRDVKPENILIDKRGRVKIADFGLAKLLGQEAADHGLTATQQVMGTLRYMAPEQMEGAKSVDHRADIYSLGVVFYELLTGELPIGRFAPPSKKVQIDVRLDEVVLRALEKEPEQRYQHASEVKSEVEQIRSGPQAPRARPAAAGGRSDLDFLTLLIVAMIAAWVWLFVEADRGAAIFGLRPVPPVVFATNLFLPLAAAALAAWVFSLVRRRPEESWVERLARYAPTLVGCHLLVFSIVIFTSHFDSLIWDHVWFETPDSRLTMGNMTVVVPKTTNQAYELGAWNTWVGRLVTTVAGIGLLALLLTAGRARLMRLRALILMFAGLAFCGALLGYVASRPPAAETFTREQFARYAPEHAAGFSAYDTFIREADEVFNRVANQNQMVPGMRVSWTVNVNAPPIVVRHYFRDEQVWFWLPGGLLMLCGAFLWRLSTAQHLERPASQISPLVALGAIIGIGGPLACLPGFIFAAIFASEASAWRHDLNTANIIGLAGFGVIVGTSLLAMTVLGVLAIIEIRRSNGRYYGVGLALLEVLLCPAPFLYGMVMGAMSAVLMGIFYPYPPPWQAVVLYVIIVLGLIAVGVWGYLRLWKRLKLPPVRSVGPASLTSAGSQ